MISFKGSFPNNYSQHQYRQWNFLYTFPLYSKLIFRTTLTVNKNESNTYSMFSDPNGNFHDSISVLKKAEPVKTP